jgi:hypothetical protein
MLHICYEGNCASDLKPQAFPTARGLRTHQNRCHSDVAEEETSLGNARELKRKRDAEDEACKRQRVELETQLALEAANRELEPQPVPIIDNAPFKGYGLIFDSVGPIVGAHS